MQIDIFTLFPDVCMPYLQASIMKRAHEMGAVNVDVHNIRDYATDKHKVTDDTPYGGGGGMLMKPEPIFNAVESVLGEQFESPLIMVTPQGQPFTQSIAREMTKWPKFALLCGRYEGIDERVRDNLVTHELSLGDFVLTGGELPALAITDAVTRLLPGVLGDPTATHDDSHSEVGLLEYPQYTRPPVYREWGIPEILTSGHHANIQRWRRDQALLRTLERRPELLDLVELSKQDLKVIDAAKQARGVANANSDK